MYIPPRRLIIPRASLDMLKAHNCLVYVLGDCNGDYRLLDDRQNKDPIEQLIELMEIDEWNHLGPDFKTFHNQLESGTPDKVMEYQWNVLNWRIQRGPEIGTDHTPIMLTLLKNPIKLNQQSETTTI